MKTSKAFSTISYNTADFLICKLDDLIKDNKIQFYAFVEHLPEADEKKAHKHLYIIPNGQFNTDTLKPYLSEIDTSNVLAPPLSIMPCQSSKFDDWYLYCCHDVLYLKSKGQARAYHYTIDDFITSSSDYLVELTHTINRLKYTKTLDFIEKVNNGAKFNDLVSNGQVPISLFSQYRNMYDYMTMHIDDDTLFRGERQTHTPKDRRLTPIQDDDMPF